MNTMIAKSLVGRILHIIRHSWRLARKEELGTERSHRTPQVQDRRRSSLRLPERRFMSLAQTSRPIQHHSIRIHFERGLVHEHPLSIAADFVVEPSNQRQWK